MKTKMKLLPVIAGAFGVTLALSACGGSSSAYTPSQEVLDALTVTTVDVKTCEADASGMVPFDIGSLKGVPPRVWTDAISTPVADENNAPRSLADVQWAICHDPVLGVTWAHALADVKVGDVTIGELNEWLKPYAVDASQINDQADSFIPLRDLTPSEKTEEKVNEAVKKNGEYQELAQKVNTLLNRFLNTGIGAPMSEWNYHLAGGGAVVGKLPEVALNDKQENLKSVVLVLTEKGNSCPVVAIGANVYDKRPEGFPTGCNAEGQPNVGQPVPGTPGGPPPEGTGGNPPPPVNPPPVNPPTYTPPPTTHTPPPTTHKIPSQGSGPQGNAPTGQGPNATPGPGVQQPYTPPPAAPYTPPPAPAYTPPPAPPVVAPTRNPAPPVIVAPSQPPNHGTVPTESGCGNPDFC